MPELPEVETVVRQLQPLLTGRRVRRFQVFDPLLKLERPALLEGRTIAGLQRIGKQIAIEFVSASPSSKPLWLTIHLRMTGRLLWADAAPELRAPIPPAPLRALWTLDRGALLFSDTRRFGVVRLLDRLELTAGAGLDPVTGDFDGAVLRGLVRGSSQAIKPWLLRQDRLVGVGNIYASEALHLARIHPERSAGSLTAEECGHLAEALRQTLLRAIAAGGTTFSDFQNARGDVGAYQKNLQVYDREGSPCPRCGKPIRRLVQQQRSTYFCAGCQRKRSGGGAKAIKD